MHLQPSEGYSSISRVTLASVKKLETLVDSQLDRKYPTWLFNSSPWYRWPIEIDGLPGFTY